MLYATSLFNLTCKDLNTIFNFCVLGRQARFLGLVVLIKKIDIAKLEEWYCWSGARLTTLAIPMEYFVTCNGLKKSIHFCSQLKAIMFKREYIISIIMYMYMYFLICCVYMVHQVSFNDR